MQNTKTKDENCNEIVVLHKGLQVIGAGLPRTGTTSLSIALRTLLGGDCYHMNSVLNGGSRSEARFWDSVLTGRKKPTAEEWRNFFAARDFRACVDFPCAIYYRELMEAFPEAKVILSIRSPKSWHESVSNSIASITKTIWDDFAVRLLVTVLSKIHAKFRAVWTASSVLYFRPDGMEHSLISATDSGVETSEAFFNAWVKQVRSTVPPEKLLIFEAKQGWQPLCAFLQVDVPPAAKPYPRKNDTARYKKMQITLKYVAYFLVYVNPIIIALSLLLVLAFYTLYAPQV